MSKRKEDNMKPIRKSARLYHNLESTFLSLIPIPMHDFYPYLNDNDYINCLSLNKLSNQIITSTIYNYKQLMNIYIDIPGLFGKTKEKKKKKTTTAIVQSFAFNTREVINFGPFCFPPSLTYLCIENSYFRIESGRYINTFLRENKTLKILVLSQHWYRDYIDPFLSTSLEVVVISGDGFYNDCDCSYAHHSIITKTSFDIDVKSSNIRQLFVSYTPCNTYNVHHYTKSERNPDSIRIEKRVNMIIYQDKILDVSPSFITKWSEYYTNLANRDENQSDTTQFHYLLDVSYKREQEILEDDLETETEHHFNINPSLYTSYSTSYDLFSKLINGYIKRKAIEEEKRIKEFKYYHQVL